MAVCQNPVSTQCAICPMVRQMVRRYGQRVPQDAFCGWFVPMVRLAWFVRMVRLAIKRHNQQPPNSQPITKHNKNSSAAASLQQAQHKTKTANNKSTAASQAATNTPQPANSQPTPHSKLQNGSPMVRHPPGLHKNSFETTANP